MLASLGLTETSSRLGNARYQATKNDVVRACQIALCAGGMISTQSNDEPFFFAISILSRVEE